jgi:hypothetical protein
MCSYRVARNLWKDSDVTTIVAKEQPLLQLPRMSFPTATQADVSPRFDNLMNRSESVPWSPLSKDISDVHRPSNFTSTSYKYIHPGDAWSTNNVDNRSSDLWSPIPLPSKTPEPLFNRNQVKLLKRESLNNTLTEKVQTNNVSRDSSILPMIERFLVKLAVHLVVNLVYSVSLLVSWLFAYHWWCSWYFGWENNHRYNARENTSTYSNMHLCLFIVYAIVVVHTNRTFLSWKSSTFSIKTTNKTNTIEQHSYIFSVNLYR